MRYRTDSGRTEPRAKDGDAVAISVKGPVKNITARDLAVENPPLPIQNLLTNPLLNPMWVWGNWPALWTTPLSMSYYAKELWSMVPPPWRYLAPALCLPPTEAEEAARPGRGGMLGKVSIGKAMIVSAKDA